MAVFNSNRQVVISMIMPKRVIDLVSKLSRQREEVVSGQLRSSIGAAPFATRDDPIFARLKIDIV